MEEVDPVDLPPELRGKKGYQRFKLRHPEICAQFYERMRVQEMLERFRDDVILDLSSGHTDAKSGLPDEFEFANTNGALDIVNKRGIGISMAFEILEPLFNAKITEAERMIVAYRFAATVLHELCVSFIKVYIHVEILTELSRANCEHSMHFGIVCGNGA